jgi:hypothetical protein
MAHEKAHTEYKHFLSQIRQQYTPRSDRFECVFTLPPGVLAAARVDSPLGFEPEFNFINQDVSSPEYGNINTVKTLTLMCEEAQLPGISVTNLPFKVGAWTEFRSQNVEFLTQDSVFTFIADENFRIRGVFEKWIELSVDPVSKEVGFYKDLAMPVDISVLDLQDNVKARYRLIDAVPKLINITPVTWSNNQHLRISVSMSAKKWERIYEGVSPYPHDALYEEQLNTVRETGVGKSRTFREIFSSIFNS